MGPSLIRFVLHIFLFIYSQLPRRTRTQKQTRSFIFFPARTQFISPSKWRKNVKIFVVFHLDEDLEINSRCTFLQSKSLSTFFWSTNLKNRPIDRKKGNLSKVWEDVRKNNMIHQLRFWKWVLSLTCISDEFIQIRAPRVYN